MREFVNKKITANCSQNATKKYFKVTCPDTMNNLNFQNDPADQISINLK